MTPRPLTLLIRAALLTASLLAALGSQTSAQQKTPEAGASEEIQAHFAAAQQAQREKNYAAAEREYQSVITLAPNFAEVHMNLGLVYQLQNQLPEAMREFQRALKLKPSLTGANFFLGVDHVKLGDASKAIPFLQAALRAEPNKPEVWLWLATAEEISGDLPAEVETMRHAVELQPTDVDFLYLLGHAYERLGKQQAARLETVSSDSSRKEEFLAQSYAASNEWPSAVIHFQNALTSFPNRSGLHVQLGEVLLHAGRELQASREFDAELRLHPNDLRALVRRGEIELLEQNVDSALRDWEQALAVDGRQVENILGVRDAGFGYSDVEQLPTALRERLAAPTGQLQNLATTAARLALAFIAAQSGNYARVPVETEHPAAGATGETSGLSCTGAALPPLLQQQQFSRLAGCAKGLLTLQTPVEVRYQVVDALLEAGEYAGALRALQGLPSSEQKSLEAAYWRARCYEKLATSTYVRLYQADPNSYRLHQLMGDIESARGDDGKAIAEYRAALASNPSVPNLHYSLGHLLWKDLKVPEARVELEAELALNPHHPGALNDLGDTFLLEHQPEKALTYLNSALAADPGNLDIHRDLGTAYSELGDYRKAEEQLKIAVAADHDGSVHYKLARAYQALGDKENAAREFALSTAMNRESHSKLEKQTERLAEITNSTQETN